MEDSKTKKGLYLVTLKGMTSAHSGVAFGMSYVVADNPDEAYKKVRDFLKEKDIGNERVRQLKSIELIAESYRYTDSDFMLYL